MSRLWLIVLVCMVCMMYACSNKDSAPAGILSKDKMESVLWDIIQAERFTATFLTKDTTKNIQLENFKLYDQVFQIHDISREDFIKSYKFYLSRPDIARVLFDSLTTRSNREREELYKPKPDSTQADRPDSAGVATPTPKVDTPKTTQPAPPAKPVRVKDSATRVLRQRVSDSTRAKINPDTIKRRLLRPQNRLLRPGMFNRDSLLRSRQ